MVQEAVDRRANPRFSAVFNLDGKPADGTIVARMEARDLSVGGLRCVSATDFPEMTRLAVQLHLPVPGNGTTEAVDIEAVVVRREKLDSPTQNDTRYELALFFVRLDDETKTRIAHFLER